MALTINKTDLVQIGGSAGRTVVDVSSPLTRLNYFDGKFLRAPDMQAEQAALLAQMNLSSQGGGAGLVHGFDCTLQSGDVVRVSDGLGFDWQGRPLLMTQTIDIGIADLIAASQNMSVLRARSAGDGLRADFADCPPVEQPLDDGNIVSSATFYLIVLNHIEAHCGEDDVYGKLCSEACISDTARSHIVQGVEISAVPISLSLKQSSQPFDNRHLRSRAASALFEKERKAIASLISAQGLYSTVWCLGAEALTGQGVAIGLLGRSATTTLFLDAWGARRERIDMPPYQYWAARLAMRSTRIYLAQIAQFQCQLRDCLGSPGDKTQPTPDDPCADEKNLLQSTAVEMDLLVQFYARAAEQMPNLVETFSVERPRLDVAELERHIETLRAAGLRPAGNQILIDCGIVELPSAGYLPVAPASNLSVNRQVRQLLGAGVDLRFCVVRPDFVPHALEEAQHMERICLVSGLDDPSQKPQLDILVPDGRIEVLEENAPVAGLRAEVAIDSRALDIGSDPKQQPKDTVGVAMRAKSNMRVKYTLPSVRGAARSATEQGRPVFYLAAETAPARASGKTAAGLLRAEPQNVLRLLRDGGGAPATVGPGPAAEVSEAMLSEMVVDVSTERQGSVVDFGIGLSLWVEMSASSDPFAATKNARIDVNARFILVGRRNGAEQGTEQRTINGRLTVEKNVAISGGAEVSGRLQATGQWQHRRLVNGQLVEHTETVTINDEVVLRRTQVAGLPPSLVVTLRNPGFFGGLGNIDLVFDQRWTSQHEQRFRAFVRERSSVVGVIGTVDSARELDLVNGTLVADANALKPGSDPHSAALDAINSIDAVLRGAGFAESAANALFPAPAPIPDELKIIAEHPWVLFHRRRTKVCEHERVVEAVRPARRYRLYHAHLDADTTTEEFVAAIQADFAAAVASLDVRQDGEVEFGPGQQSVVTTHSDVRESWGALLANVDADLHIGVIASQGDAIDDGVSLARARLRSLTDVLAPVSQSAPDLQLLTTSNVPTGLATGELDGVIVYFTREVGTVCHSVMRFTGTDPDAIFERLRGYLEAPDGQTLINFIQDIGGKVLSATPRFVDGTDQFFTPSDADQLDKDWNLVEDGGTVTQALALTSESDADEQRVAVSQSVRIVSAVGSSLAAENVPHFSLPPTSFKGCPRSTILVAATQCNSVFHYQAFGGSLGAAVKLVQTFVVSGDLSAVLEQTEAVRRIGSVEFFAGTDDFETVSLNRFTRDWEQFLGGTSPASIKAAILGVARSGANADETSANEALAREQAANLGAAMRLSVEPPVLAAVNNPEVDFPDDCRAITIVVSVRVFRGIIAGVRVIDANSDDVTLDADEADPIGFVAGGAVVRDARLRRTIERLRETDEPVSSVEIVSLAGSSGDEARARAEGMLAALREAGVASANARVVERTANERERVEIVRSGLILNDGLILRR